MSCHPNAHTSLEWLAFVTNTLSAWWVGGTAAEVALVALWHLSLWSLPLVWLDSSRDRSRWRNTFPVWASLGLIFAQPYTAVCRKA
eukprot:gene21317-23268_t